MKFLVIEDYTDIASDIRQYFARASHIFDFAYDGIHGLNLAVGFHFDLIIPNWPANPFSLWAHIHGLHLKTDTPFTNPIQRIHGHGYRIGGERL